MGAVPDLLSKVPEDRKATLEYLTYFLGHEVATPFYEHFSVEFTGLLVPWVRSAIYWAELDGLRRDIKGVAFTMVSRRLRSLLQAGIDPETAAFHLRQAIEIAYWALYCCYGAEVARHQVERSLVEKKKKYIAIESSDVENFLRGWFAPDRDRVEAGLRAIGKAGPYNHPSGYVTENEVHLVKQRGIVRFWASNVEAHGHPGLTAHVEVLESAYEYLCGWIHVSPILVCYAAGSSKHVDPVSISDLLREVAKAIHGLFRELIFHPLWDQRAYLPVVLSWLDPESRERASLGVVGLPELLHKSKPVEFPLPDGTKIAPYPKR